MEAGKVQSTVQARSPGKAESKLPVDPAGQQGNFSRLLQEKKELNQADKSGEKLLSGKTAGENRVQKSLQPKKEESEDLSDEQSISENLSGQEAVLQTLVQQTAAQLVGILSQAQEGSAKEEVGLETRLEGIQAEESTWQPWFAAGQEEILPKAEAENSVSKEGLPELGQMDAENPKLSQFQAMADRKVAEEKPSVQLPEQAIQASGNQSEVAEEPQQEWQITQTVENQPKVTKQQPKIAEDQSKIVNDQPKVTEQQPKISEDQSKIVNDQPKVTEQQPKISEDQSRIVDNQPQITEQQPKISEDQSKIVDNQPQITEQQPKISEDQSRIDQSKVIEQQVSAETSEQSPQVPEISAEQQSQSFQAARSQSELLTQLQQPEKDQPKTSVPLQQSEEVQLEWQKAPETQGMQPEDSSWQSEVEPFAVEQAELEAGRQIDSRETEPRLEPKVSGEQKQTLNLSEVQPGQKEEPSKEQHSDFSGENRKSEGGWAVRNQKARLYDSYDRRGLGEETGSYEREYEVHQINTWEQPHQVYTMNQRTWQIPLKTSPETLPMDLGKALASRLPANNQTLTVELEPASLGKLTIKLVYEAGRAEVSILSSNPKTLEILSQKAGEIANILEEKTGQQTIIYTQPAQQESQDSGQYSSGRGNRDGQEEQRQNQKESQHQSESFAQQLRLGLV